MSCLSSVRLSGKRLYVYLKILSADPEIAKYVYFRRNKLSVCLFKTMRWSLIDVFLAKCLMLSGTIASPASRPRTASEFPLATANAAAPPETLPGYEIKHTRVTGLLFPTVDLAAEVYLSWSYYETHMGGLMSPYDRFAGYTIQGNYKDLRMRTRFYNVGSRGSHGLSNMEAALVAEQVYERFMREWELFSLTYNAVSWTVEMQGAMIAMGTIDRAPSEPAQTEQPATG